MGRKPTGRKPGRPPGRIYKRGSVLLLPETWEKVAEVADREGISRLELMRRAIEGHVRRR